MMEKGPIGFIRDRVLVKKGKQVVLMVAMDGFGVPEKLLRSGELDGVEINYKGKDYGVDLDTFLSYGIPYKHAMYEAQLILPRRYWKVREEQK